MAIYMYIYICVYMIYDTILVTSAILKMLGYGLKTYPVLRTAYAGSEVFLATWQQRAVFDNGLSCSGSLHEVQMGSAEGDCTCGVETSLQDYDLYEEELKKSLTPTLKSELCYHIYKEGHSRQHVGSCQDVLNAAPFLAWSRAETETLNESQ